MGEDACHLVQRARGSAEPGFYYPGYESCGLLGLLQREDGLISWHPVLANSPEVLGALEGPPHSHRRYSQGHLKSHSLMLGSRVFRHLRRHQFTTQCNKLPVPHNQLELKQLVHLPL